MVVEAHGIYVPQLFCQMYGNYITNMEEIKEDFQICLEGPEHENYWDAWDVLLGRIEFTNDNGERLTIDNLYDSGDLWAIPEGYEYPEY